MLIVSFRVAVPTHVCRCELGALMDQLARQGVEVRIAGRLVDHAPRDGLRRIDLQMARTTLPCRFAQELRIVAGRDPCR